MREIAAFDGLLIVHAEDAETIDRRHRPGAGYSDFLASRPRQRRERRDRATSIALAEADRLPGCTSCTSRAATRCR